MTGRTKRLGKLVALQEKLGELHKTRHAVSLAEAARAGEEAQDIAARFDAEGSLSGLFPEVYHDRVARALARRDASLATAAEEASLAALQSARARRVDEAWQEAKRDDERQAEDRERLDLIETMRRSGTSET